eukprot:CAMPEP_0175272604 /NCGR_PEP_ID=MMETSP0093-20121207/46513_1 /TAXON_ID=311494 /ORGANISM="Alexandrium monilatum, Strain CCMP3105" /LENGTH=35 /DNA_ID= /DNA_START= /DNA_END= /DNA_ORIENTATION=
MPLIENINMPLSHTENHRKWPTHRLNKLREDDRVV